MSQDLHSAPQEGGNTSTPSPASKRIRKWFFTLNGYTTDDITRLHSTLPTHVFQEETGDGGNKHLQGCVSFKEGKTFSAAKKAIDIRAHIEPVIDWDSAIRYCTKTETRTGQIYSLGIPIPKKLKDIIKEQGPNPLQKHLLGLLDQPPNDRTIFWVYDSEGNTGKTTLAKHIVDNRNAIYVGGKASDIKYAVKEWLQTHDGIDYILFDLTRAMQNKMSYTALEEVKNGIFFCTKYESGMCRYDSPHVMVFANYEPEYDLLTKDRWHVINCQRIEYESCNPT